MLADLLINDEEGGEWLREEIARLNEVLESAGLAPHTEPEETEPYNIGTYGYSGLHHLRRCAAHLQYKKKLPQAFGADENPVEDQLYSRYSQAFEAENGRAPPGTFAFSSEREFDHLIMHSDAEGFYVPQHFESVLIGGREAYGWVGSSYALRRECERLAEVLELPEALLMNGEDLAFEEAVELAANQLLAPEVAAWRRHPISAMMCAKLYNCASHSIRTGALVVFC